METAKKHYAFLDQMRGIAIIGVFLYHCLLATFGYNNLPWDGWFRDFSGSTSFICLLPLSLGWAGVAIFFVVSGFCIHLSFYRNPNWMDFWVRRFFRIYPPYFLAVLFFALFIPGSRVSASLLGFSQILTHLLLIHNFWDPTIISINISFWSIAVEAQLYLLYPLLLLLVSRLGWNRSLWMIAVLELGFRLAESLALTVGGVYPPLWWNGLSLMYWYSWSIGAALAESHLSGQKILFSNHSWVAWVVLATGSYFLKPLSSFSFLFFSLATAAWIAKLLSSQSTQLSLPRAITSSFSDVGVWSYSIYLLHQPLLSLSPMIAQSLNLPDSIRIPALFSLCLMLWIPIVGLSFLWYQKFELTSISLGKQLARSLTKSGS